MLPRSLSVGSRSALRGTSLSQISEWTGVSNYRPKLIGEGAPRYPDGENRRYIYESDIIWVGTGLKSEVVAAYRGSEFRFIPKKIVRVTTFHISSESVGRNRDGSPKYLTLRVSKGLLQLNRDLLNGFYRSISLEPSYLGFLRQQGFGQLADRLLAPSLQANAWHERTWRLFGELLSTLE